MVTGAKRRCERGQQRLTVRPNAARRGYGYRWRKYSRRYLASHPLCVRCFDRGIAEASRCVDHIQPVTGPDDDQFWNPDNHQALCDQCHGLKTATEDKGRGRRGRGAGRRPPGPTG